jgi:hypothetical protein
MTFDDYIKNPMGKKNSVFSNMQMYRDMYKKKLDLIMLREAGKITYNLYMNGNDYIVHIRIPSEVVPKFYYDTVVEFSTINPFTSMKKDLRDYDVRFYSNDPSFCFTFAHAFKKHNMFIDMLKPKMPKTFLNTVAKERNAGSNVGYVKSLFFLYLIMNSKGLFQKNVFEIYVKPFNKKLFVASIEDADTKILARQEQGKRIEAEKRAKRNKVEKRPVKDNVIDKQSNVKQPVKSVTKTKTTNKSRTSTVVKKK